MVGIVQASPAPAWNVAEVDRQRLFLFLKYLEAFKGLRHENEEQTCWSLWLSTADVLCVSNY